MRVAVCMVVVMRGFMTDTVAGTGVHIVVYRHIMMADSGERH
jgi:hypothetical protein